ncbi:MAG: zinc-ribbon domain-containing protein [Actinobacteria bacterium]|nr:zinc-ribbon domain-containing protein [Actinomycetota bacterium]MBU1492883.1 zinc-ribbon domain-containing protein [Actinomycetota bacterium]MBU1865445.1 zinc-ribbon domain-containing protein [Actinomycetota bacterium]
MLMRCGNCSEEIPDTAKVCGYCGTPLRQPPTTEQALSADPPPPPPVFPVLPHPQPVASAVPTHSILAQPEPNRVTWVGLAALVGAVVAALSVQSTWLFDRVSMWDIGDSTWECARQSANDCSYGDLLYSTEISGGFFGLASIWLVAGTAGVLAMVLMARRGRRSGGGLSGLVVTTVTALLVVGGWDAYQFYRFEIESPGVYGYDPGPTILAAGMLVSAVGLALALAWSGRGDAL